MISKETKEIQISFFTTRNDRANQDFLGNKTNRAEDDEDFNKTNPLKTKIHGLIFQKNNSEKITKKITCNCKNSQCLKLYCECFSKLAYCDPEICCCKGCANTKENEVIQIFYRFWLLLFSLNSKKYLLILI